MLSGSEFDSNTFKNWPKWSVITKTILATTLFNPVGCHSRFDEIYSHQFPSVLCYHFSLGFLQDSFGAFGFS